MQAVTFNPSEPIEDIVVRMAQGLVDAVVSDWPVPWIVADQFTGKPGSTEQLGLARLLVLPHPVWTPDVSGDLVALLTAATKTKSNQRIALLEQAWRV